jgi:hypothetical protein
VKGTMGSKEYEEIVRKEVLLSARDLFQQDDWTLQQDLAPCHTSRKVRILDINNFDTVNIHFEHFKSIIISVSYTVFQI